jgi:hypothetical protein
MSKGVLVNACIVTASDVRETSKKKKKSVSNYAMELRNKCDENTKVVMALWGWNGLRFIHSHLVLKVEGSDNNDEVAILCSENVAHQAIDCLGHASRSMGFVNLDRWRFSGVWSAAKNSSWEIFAGWHVNGLHTGDSHPPVGESLSGAEASCMHDSWQIICSSIRQSAHAHTLYDQARLKHQNIESSWGWLDPWSDSSVVIAHSIYLGAVGGLRFESLYNHFSDSKAIVYGVFRSHMIFIFISQGLLQYCECP